MEAQVWSNCVKNRTPLRLFMTLTHIFEHNVGKSVPFFLFVFFLRDVFHVNQLSSISCFVNKNSDTIIKSFRSRAAAKFSAASISRLILIRSPMWGFMPLTSPISIFNCTDWTFNLEGKVICSVAMKICRVSDNLWWSAWEIPPCSWGVSALREQKAGEEEEGQRSEQVSEEGRRTSGGQVQTSVFCGHPRLIICFTISCNFVGCKPPNFKHTWLSLFQNHYDFQICLSFLTYVHVYINGMLQQADTARLAALLGCKVVLWAAVIRMTVLAGQLSLVQCAV